MAQKIYLIVLMGMGLSCSSQPALKNTDPTPQQTRDTLSSSHYELK